jgi:hypothetical protein
VLDDELDFVFQELDTAGAVRALEAIVEDKPCLEAVLDDESGCVFQELDTAGAVRMMKLDPEPEPEPPELVECACGRWLCRGEECVHPFVEEKAPAEDLGVCSCGRALSLGGSCANCKWFDVAYIDEDGDPVICDAMAAEFGLSTSDVAQLEDFFGEAVRPADPLSWLLSSPGAAPPSLALGNSPPPTRCSTCWQTASWQDLEPCATCGALIHAYCLCLCYSYSDPETELGDRDASVLPGGFLLRMIRSERAVSHQWNSGACASGLWLDHLCDFCWSGVDAQASCGAGEGTPGLG